MGKSKRYRAALQGVTREQRYPLAEAVDLVKAKASAKFDETIDCAVRLHISGNQSVRDTLSLPHSFQSEQRIVVFARDQKAAEARAAGATEVGAEDLVAKIQGGWVDFDVAVATPDMMRDVGRLGPILGRRGLMPNPKTRTVTNDITATLAELRKGRVEFRADKAGVIHMAVGKASMDAGQIAENVQFLIGEVDKRRPADLKGEFMGNVALSSTMGPGVKVAANE
jgi:large subunit ribosomal protein L1